MASHLGSHRWLRAATRSSLAAVLAVGLASPVLAEAGDSGRPEVFRSSAREGASPSGVALAAVEGAGSLRVLASPTRRPIVQDVVAGPGPALALVAGLVLLLLALLWRMRRERAERDALRAALASRDAADLARGHQDAIHRAYYDNTPDNLFVLRVEGARFVMEDCNLAHGMAVGRDCSEILGKDLREILPRELGDRLAAHARSCVDENRLVRFELDANLPSGPRRWETVLAPVRDGGGTVSHVVGTSRDVTEQRELEEKLRQGQKMEAIGQLTGGIAHDFNNLLTVIIGNLDLLKQARDDRRPTLIDNALRAIERARELTQKLLAFGRRQALNPEPTDLKALIAGMDDMLMQSLRGDIRLEMDLAQDLWDVEIDQAQFQVALINLAANARDAMPGAGVLRITAVNTSSREGGDEGVEISVSDTGQGMSPDVKARAFDPFFTTKEVGKGTGLGLPQVYSFAQQSGGAVYMESEVDRGTTVRLFLPRARTPVASREAGSADADGDLRSLKILLVEDNIKVAEVAASILQEHAHRVVIAHSADEALAALESGRDFDFVFTDLVMPGERNGLDLARTIRGRWKDLPVLLATGYSEAGALAKQEGFPLLPKPYRASTLVATITRVSAQARGRSSDADAPSRQS